jgi:hypothetical protein
LARAVVGQLDDAQQAQMAAVAQAAALTAAVTALRDALAHEQAVASGKDRDRWPIATALRDFWHRRRRS